MSPRSVARLSTIDPAVLGARIRAYRRAAQLRQRELVDEAGISVAYLSRIETGARRPSVAVLQRIAARLKADVDRLLVEDKEDDDEAAAVCAVAVNAAAWTVTEAAALRRWERVRPGRLD